jgi:uncharacterized protein
MKWVAVVALGALLVLGPVPPSDLAAQERRLVIIASGWVVGVYYPLAGAMSRIAYSTRDLNIRAAVESSGGSVANAQLISAGDADFALLQNDIAYYAYTGTTLAPFEGRPVKDMGGVFTIYPELVHIVASRASGVKSVRDLRGKRVILGPRGSGSEQNALQILEVYGLSASDLGRVEWMDGAPAAEALREGRVDGAFFTTGVDSAVIVDILGSGKAVLVPVDATASEALRAKYPFYTLGTVPAKTYKRQERELTTPAVMAMIVARSGLPEDLVYRFTKAIFDNLGQLHAAHVAAKGLTLQTALKGMPIPLHPGAARFFKEKGISR